MDRPSNYLPGMAAKLRRQRRKVAAASPRAFAELYLKTHCRLPPSRMHREMYQLLAKITDTRGARVAIAAPRGHAKSTIVSLAYVLWCVLYGKERLVLIVSDTKEQATLLLKHVKDEVQGNPLLLSDFPEVCQPTGAPGRPKPWRDNRVQLRNGAMILAYGVGQNLRGAKHGEDRPGLILADDLENREQVISEEQRNKLSEWFSGTLLHAGHPGTNVIVVGTVLHHDSLLANLIDPTRRSGWIGRKYKAIEKPSDHPQLWEHWSSIFSGLKEFNDQTGPDAAGAYFKKNRKKMLEGAQVLWPELDDYHTLMIIREREGKASFQAEKQNEPTDPEQCVFDESTFQYWDDEYADEQHLIEAIGDKGKFYGACDPSLGRRTGRGDLTAIIILLKDWETKVHYVIAAHLSHLRPDKTIERIVQYGRMYRFRCFAVEANQFQELMLDTLVRRLNETDVILHLWKIKSKTDKHARIASLEPLVSQGRIRFCRRHQQLIEQLRQFPLAVHDDGPDALEMAMQAAKHGPPLPPPAAPFFRRFD